MVDPEQPGPATTSTVEPDDRVEVAFDGDGRLAEDLACRSCGYNLRGLNAERSCPECDTAIGRSIYGDLLRYSDPDWVERLASGMRLWVISIVAGVIFVFVAAGMAFAAFATTGAVGPVVLTILLTGVGTITAIKLYAIWQTTTPDPGVEEVEQPLTPRAIARWGLILASIASAGVAVIETGGGLATVTSGTPLKADLVHLGLVIIAAISGLVGMAFLFVYAQALALRIPDDAIARSTRAVMWGFLITTGIVQLLDIVSKVQPMTAATPGVQTVFSVMLAVAMIPALVFWIWGVVLVFKYRNRLTSEAARARRTWAEAA